jgi:hypothetical protein
VWYGPDSVKVSPDGRFLYAASSGIGSALVAAFTRDLETGALTQLAGPAGCLSGIAFDGCAFARGFTGGPYISTPDMELSSDGRNVYVVTDVSVASFARDATTGALSQLPEGEGCLAASVPGCAPMRHVVAPGRLAIAPDGLELYVSTEVPLVVLRRDPVSGALSQLPGRRGCLGDTPAGRPIAGCAPPPAAFGFAMSASADGAALFLGGQGVIDSLRRDPGGGLTVGSRRGSCLSYSTAPRSRCKLVPGLDPRALLASSDGASLYVLEPGELRVFGRAADGRLRPLPAPLGCARNVGRGCTRARGLSAAGFGALAESPDGRSLYAVGSGIAAFTRVRDSG